MILGSLKIVRLAEAQKRRGLWLAKIASAEKPESMRREQKGFWLAKIVSAGMPEGSQREKEKVLVQRLLRKKFPVGFRSVRTRFGSISLKATIDETA
jgi:hypothetical protein